MTSTGKNRRDFLKRIGGAMLGSATAGKLAASPPKELPNPVGYAVIAWPQKDFDTALAAISALHFQGVQLLGWSLDQFSKDPGTLRARLEILKLQPAALSCWGVRLDPAHERAEDVVKFKEYVAFMKALGGRHLQITDGGHPGASYSSAQIRNLGRRMNELGKIAGDSGLELGYHPHFGTLGETRQGMDKVLAATDSHRVKLIVDVAHMTLGGMNPVDVIHAYHKRILFFHFKDLRKDVAALAAKNRNLVRHSKYLFCPIGQGVVDFAGIVQAMRELDLKCWAIVELDGYEPPPGGPDEAARINRDAMRHLGFKI